jgi:flagellar hook protein FlgE
MTRRSIMAFAALSSGVSGLTAFTEGIGIISDNIVNVNTVGYKETRSRFSTLVTETQSVSRFSPGGVQLRAQTLVSQQGLLTSTASQTDLGIDGSGFFVVRSAPSAISAEGNIQFTRAGNFTPDEAGFLKNTAGNFLLGFPIDVQGNIPTNIGDLNTLEPINVHIGCHPARQSAILAHGHHHRRYRTGRCCSGRRFDSGYDRAGFRANHHRVR